MRWNVKNFWSLLVAAAKAWSLDSSPRLGAALSFYTVFALPPLFVIVIFIAGLVLDPSEVRAALFSEVGGLIGEKSAEAIQSAIDAQSQEKKGVIAGIVAVVVLLVTSTGVFMELQAALNSVWGVEEKPGQGIVGFIKNRLLSFGMVIGIGFLLLVSLIASAALSALVETAGASAAGTFLLAALDAIVSFAVVTILFAMIYKILPDVRIAWRDVWIGAAVTAILFTAGKSILGAYLGRSTVVSAYGAAGSVVVILLWVYYSAQILFFGAELTRAFADRYGSRFTPRANARWIERNETPKTQQ